MEEPGEGVEGGYPFSLKPLAIEGAIEETAGKGEEASSPWGSGSELEASSSSLTMLSGSGVYSTPSSELG